MNLDKTAKFLSNWKTVLTSMLALFAVTAWAADQRYPTYEALEARDVKELRRDISELEVRKGYAKDDEDKQMYEVLIKIKENHIKEILGE